MPKRLVPLLSACGFCGVQFETLANKPGKYCSEKCQRETYNKKRREQTASRRPLSQTCKQCGVSFSRGSYAKLGSYCSKKCARSANYSADPETQRERCRKWREANKDAHKRSKAKWIERNRERNTLSKKNYQLKRDFGITLKQYEQMCEQQNNSCAICNEQFGKWRLRPDHCHSSGRLRGLLCDKCNLGLGLFNDDPRRMMNAIAYLKS